jgi:hypothetical protein
MVVKKTPQLVPRLQVSAIALPFAGGGAHYFALAPGLKKASLVDRNLELVLAYQSIKNQRRRYGRTAFKLSKASGFSPACRASVTPTVSLITICICYSSKALISGLLPAMAKCMTPQSSGN